MWEEAVAHCLFEVTNDSRRVLYGLWEGGAHREPCARADSPPAPAGTFSGLAGDGQWSEDADPGGCFQFESWLFFNSVPGQAREGRRLVCKAAAAAAGA